MRNGNLAEYCSPAAEASQLESERLGHLRILAGSNTQLAEYLSSGPGTKYNVFRDCIRLVSADILDKQPI
jgi:hypothetical protein